MTRRAQKAALTKAIRSGSPERITAASIRAVAQWEADGHWPDDWSDWQRALDDAHGFGGVNLDDLIGLDERSIDTT